MEDVQLNNRGEIQMNTDPNNRVEMIVADVDGTLNMTNVKEDNKKIFVPSLIAAGRDSGILSDRFAECAKKDFAHYFAIEHNPDISHEEKVIQMENWWKSQFKNLQDEPLTLTHLKQMMNWEGLQLRRGWRELMDFCKDNNIPFVFLSSSGLGADAIKIFLEKQELMTPNVKIVSNQLTWDSSGVMTGYKEPIMHSFVDKENFLIESGIRIPSKVIVIGNSLGDANMVRDIKNRKVCRFGICQKKPNDDYKVFSENWKRFEKVFYTVLGDEEKINPIIRMAKNFTL